MPKLKPKSSPLNCREYFVADQSIQANPKHDPQREVRLKLSELVIEAEVVAEKAETKAPFWRVSLRIQQGITEENNTPYAFDITLIGAFQVQPAYPADSAKRLVEINGKSVLYSAARQILRNAMSNGPYAPLLLPTVSFFEPETPAASLLSQSQDQSPSHAQTS